MYIFVTLSVNHLHYNNSIEVIKYVVFIYYGLSIKMNKKKVFPRETFDLLTCSP